MVKIAKDLLALSNADFVEKVLKGVADSAHKSGGGKGFTKVEVKGYSSIYDSDLKVTIKFPLSKEHEDDGVKEMGELVKEMSVGKVKDLPHFSEFLMEDLVRTLNRSSKTGKYTFYDASAKKDGNYIEVKATVEMNPK